MNKGGKEGAEKLQKDDVHYEVKAQEEVDPA